MRPDTDGMTGKFAATSAATGASVGVLIIFGYIARTAVALRRNGQWNDARSFLGFR